MAFLFRSLTATAVTVACFAMPSAASAAGDPITCVGYPEARSFVENQSGWSDLETTSYGDAEHVHAGACYPKLGQVIRGTIQIDVVTKMHNVAGQYLRKVRIQTMSNRGSGPVPEVDFGTMRQCMVKDCTFITPLTINTDNMGSGKWELRVHSDLRRFAPPSLQPANLATGGWLMCVRTCTGTRDGQAVPYPATEGRGWYKQSDGAIAGYITGRLMEAIPATVSGTWRPLVRIVGGSNEGTNPVNNAFCSVDPDFHNADPAKREGRVLVRHAGEYRNERLSIDTTKLTNGVHRLMLRAHGTSGYVGQQWGSSVILFTVANRSAPPL